MLATNLPLVSRSIIAQYQILYMRPLLSPARVYARTIGLQSQNVPRWSVFPVPESLGQRLMAKIDSTGKKRAIERGLLDRAREGPGLAKDWTMWRRSLVLRAVAATSARRDRPEPPASRMCSALLDQAAPAAPRTKWRMGMSKVKLAI